MTTHNRRPIWTERQIKDYFKPEPLDYVVGAMCGLIALLILFRKDLYKFTENMMHYYSTWEVIGWIVFIASVLGTIYMTLTAIANWIDDALTPTYINGKPVVKKKYPDPIWVRAWDSGIKADTTAEELRQAAWVMFEIFTGIPLAIRIMWWTLKLIWWILCIIGAIFNWFDSEWRLRKELGRWGYLKHSFKHTWSMGNRIWYGKWNDEFINAKDWADLNNPNGPGDNYSWEYSARTEPREPVKMIDV